MVVRLDLETDVILVVEAHDAGVVLEDADTPVVRPEPPPDLLRRAEDRLLQEVVDAPAVEIDLALERLVRTVLRPRLSQRLQLDVGRLAVLDAEVRLDGPQFRQVEGQLSVATQFLQPFVVEVAEWDGGKTERVGGTHR